MTLKPTLSLFPKFFRHLSPPQLAGLVRMVGLDTTNAIVRTGYWVSPEGLAAELPAFLRALRAEGLRVTFASTGYPASGLVADPTPLAVMAANGITEFRLGYFDGAPADPRSALKQARSELERLAPVCERHGIRAVCQLHHGTLVPSASAAWHLVQGLPARWIGIELDPGNQGFEGFENWERSARLLGGHLAAAGIKDTRVFRDAAAAGAGDKGWRREFAPIDEGVTCWHDFIRALAAVGFEGPLVFMPFYHSAEPELLTAVLAREVAWLRRVIASVAAAPAAGGKE